MLVSLSKTILHMFQRSLALSEPLEAAQPHFTLRSKHTRGAYGDFCSIESDLIDDRIEKRFFQRFSLYIYFLKTEQMVKSYDRRQFLIFSSFLAVFGGASMTRCQVGLVTTKPT